jgi:crotonobetainyl-CoA:carnitine CoA-transferase CaiB-like acyl-CoA transferase
VGVWWLVAGRNKQSVAVDLKTDEGKQILRDLLRDADVLVENFRPGVMERLGFDVGMLQELNPRLVMLRVSGFGQTGPYSERPGFGKLAEAFSGATNLTGHADDGPLHPSYSLGDVVCALMGAYGVMLALHARQTTGRGQVVDLALYEPLFRLIEWQIPLHQITQTRVHRNGPRFPFGEAFVTELCRTHDGEYIVVSAATVTHLERLATMLREHGATASLESSAEVADAVRAWIGASDRETVLAEFARHDLVAGLVYQPAHMLEDPHMRARGNIVHMPHDVLGEVPMPSVVPRLVDTPGAVRWTGPRLGEHTEQVLRERLGYDTARIDGLKLAGAI